MTTTTITYSAQDLGTRDGQTAINEGAIGPFTRGSWSEGLVDAIGYTELRANLIGDADADDETVEAWLDAYDAAAQAAAVAAEMSR